MKRIEHQTVIFSRDCITIKGINDFGYEWAKIINYDKAQKFVDDTLSEAEKSGEN